MDQLPMSGKGPDEERQPGQFLQEVLNGGTSQIWSTKPSDHEACRVGHAGRFCQTLLHGSYQCCLSSSGAANEFDDHSRLTGVHQHLLIGRRPVRILRAWSSDCIDPLQAACTCGLSLLSLNMTLP